MPPKKTEQTIPLPSRPDPNQEQNNLVRTLFQNARLAHDNPSVNWHEFPHTVIDSVQRHWMRYWLRTVQEFQPGQLTSESQEGSIQYPLDQIIEGLNYLMQWSREHKQPDPHIKDRRELYRYLIRFLKEQAAIPVCQGGSKAQHYIVVRSPLYFRYWQCATQSGANLEILEEFDQFDYTQEFSITASVQMAKLLEKSMFSAEIQTFFWSQLSTGDIADIKFPFFMKKYFLKMNDLKTAIDLNRSDHQDSYCILVTILDILAEKNEPQLFHQYEEFKLPFKQSVDTSTFVDVFQILHEESLPVEEKLSQYEEMRTLKQTYDWPVKDWDPTFRRHFCMAWLLDTTPAEYNSLMQPLPSIFMTNPSFMWKIENVKRSITFNDFGLPRLRKSLLATLAELQDSLVVQDSTVKHSDVVLPMPVQLTTDAGNQFPVEGVTTELGKRKFNDDQPVGNSVIIVPHTKVVMLDSLKIDVVSRWMAWARTTMVSNSSFDLKTTIETRLRATLEPYFRTYNILPPEYGSWEDLLTNNYSLFITLVGQLCEKYCGKDLRSLTTGTNLLSTIRDKLSPSVKNLHFKVFSNTDNTSFADLYMTLEDCYREYNDCKEKPAIDQIFKVIFNVIQKEGSAQMKSFFTEEVFELMIFGLTTFDVKFTLCIMEIEQKYLHSMANVLAVQGPPTTSSSGTLHQSGHKHKHDKGHSKSNPSKQSKSDSVKSHSTATTNSSKTPNIMCYGCGKIGHRRFECRSSHHPNFNKSEDIEWKNSKHGLAFREHARFKDCTMLPSRSQIIDGVLKEYSPPGDIQSSTHKNKKKCKYQYTLSSLPNTLDTFVLKGQIQVGKHFLYVDNILIDSGADIGNFINLRAAKQLMAQGVNLRSKDAVVKNAFGGLQRSLGSLLIDVILKKDFSETTFKLTLLVHILDDLVHDVVIGRKAIRDYELVLKLPCQFFHCEESSGSKLGALSREDVLPEKRRCECHGDNSCKHDAKNKHVTKVGELSQITSESGEIATKMSLLDYDPSTPELEAFLEQERPNPNFDDRSEDDSSLPCHIRGEDGFVVDLIIRGDENGKRMIISIIRQFTRLFRTDLPSEPAKLPCFNIDVDQKQWETKENRTSPRPQTMKKNEEIKNFITENLATGTIVNSDAAYYSQVHLVAKPDNSWRFCIDYRNLNAATKHITNWPIPNIRVMLERIGQRGATIFGIIDLKSGYHQVAVAKHIQPLLAFITTFGIYTWTRLPFGPKGAPSFFQRLMCTMVLAGLLYLICEVYIDDVIVYGTDIKDFCENLKKVLKACAQHGIILNPKKCRFGLTKIEYVGHTLDASGLTISTDKLRKIALFRQPETQHNMKSFLGLCNFVRDYVQNYSELTHLLNKMTHNYKRGEKLTWTDEGLKAFNTLVAAIEKAQKLWFYNEKLPVFLKTDASEYCLGAYLYQVLNTTKRINNQDVTISKELPIRFLSKSLQGAQLRWKIYDKEGLAIFWAIKELEYLLRDIHFTLCTDHANLTYINSVPNDRVYRWKLYFQEFDFDVKHVPGDENFVANYMSRFMIHDVEPSSQLEYLSLVNMELIDVPSDKWEEIQTVHNSVVGHGGIELTIQRLLSKPKPASYAAWPELRSHVRAFIRQCPACQKMSQTKFAIQANPFTVSSYYPGEVISMDTLTGLPTTVEGHTCIIVIIDNFTRYVELYPCKSTTEDEATSALLSHVSRYGIPSKVITDNGSQFVATSVITKLYEALHIAHIRTVAYSKEENSIVERANKEILEHLRALVYDNRTVNTWTKYLPIVQRIMNSTVHSAIGVSPSTLLHAGVIDLNRGLFDALPSVNESDTQNLGVYVKDLVEKEKLLLELSQAHQQKVNSDNLAKRRKTEPTVFPINSWVLPMYPKNRMGRRAPTKLHTPLKGPFKVIKVNDNDYTVFDEVTKSTYVYNVTQLRPFRYNPARLDPYEVALHDSQQYVVERIVSHVGRKTDRRKLRFEVKWLGYDDSENTFEPYSNLLHNVALHNYLSEHKMKSLIPAQYRKR